MDFDLISFILGNVTGVLVAAMIARAKFASLQTALRNAQRNFLDDVNDLYDRLIRERALNEGLQASLHDAAVPKAKRISA